MSDNFCFREHEPDRDERPRCRECDDAGCPACDAEIRERVEPEIVRAEAAMDDVMRYFAQGYNLNGGELLDVKYAITSEPPRRVRFHA